MKMKFLVVVDAQNDFFTGSLANEDAVKIVPNLVKKIDDVYNNKYDNTIIVFTKDTHTIPDYYETEEGKNLRIGHCIEGTSGADIIPELSDYVNTTLSKNTYGCAGLIDMLKGVQYTFDIEEIEFVGVCTDVCVITNALLARTFAPKAHIKVDASCCAGVTPEKHRAALEVMKSCNIEVINEEPYDSESTQSRIITNTSVDTDIEKLVDEKVSKMFNNSLPYFEFIRGIFG